MDVAGSAQQRSQRYRSVNPAASWMSASAQPAVMRQPCIPKLSNVGGQAKHSLAKGQQ
jgi:hypothetical protein